MMRMAIRKFRNYEYPYYSWGDSKYHLAENLYHVWYHQMLDSSTNLGRCRDYLAGYGVPTDLIDSPDILQITSFPCPDAGCGRCFMLPQCDGIHKRAGTARSIPILMKRTINLIFRPGDGISAPELVPLFLHLHKFRAG